MSNWARTAGKSLTVALIAGAALAVEVAPTLALSAPDACARIAAAFVAHSSCLATAYGDAQRIDGGAIRHDDARERSCASLGVL
ncbi:MAG TPA: hypothetical protein VF059_04925 [Casimicrobiaceae bacterium]